MSPSAEDSSAGFSCPVLLSELGSASRHMEVEADAPARTAIARRLGTPDVLRLRGVFDVTATAEGARVEGNLEAELVRECVVSLEPVMEHVAERFDIRFARGAGKTEAANGEIVIDADSPEPLEGDSLDLGEILVQQLALAMDPYPRKADARPLADTFGGDTKISPFEALKGAFADRSGQE